MKKISSYVTLALAGLLVSSCGSEYEGWADPQSYGQEDAITIPGFTATAVDAQDLATAGDSVATFSLSTAALPSGYTLANARVELTPTDGTTTTTLATSVAGKALTSELQAIVEAAYGKRPENRTFNAHVYVNAVNNGQAALIDAGTITVTAKPKAPFIDSGYYMVGDMFGWDAAGMKAFTHSGADVYDDPVFTLVLTTTKADQYWKIVTKSGADAGDIWTGALGTVTDGDASLEGTLTTDNPGAGKIEEAGIYRMTLNMMDYTYKIEKLNFTEYIYETGANTNWNNGLAMYGPNFDGKYYGAFYLNGEFKFKPNFENWEGDWEYDGEGKLNVEGNGNIPAPTPGFYNIMVDVGTLTYTLKPFTEMRVVGGAVPGGWDNGNAMTWNATDKTWELNGVTLTDGELKFRSDADWNNVNLGGSLSKLIPNGDNISVKAGTYDIILHLENASGAPYAELLPAL